METDALRAQLHRLRGETSEPPHASIIVPVNAHGDLSTVLPLLGDIASYRGPHTLEVILVINNYPPERPPPEIEHLRSLGIRVMAVPSVLRRGYAPALRARMHGLSAAAAEAALLFDADCRIPSPTTLIDWYVHQLRNGAQVAYTHVGHHDLPPDLTVRIRMRIHHTSRWAKRVIGRVPTTRGSNYAVARTAVLRRYEEGFIADEMHVGPAMKAAGGRVVYGGAKDLMVLTSARRISGGWAKLAQYFTSRLRYNIRALRVRPDAARYTGREDVPRAAKKGSRGTPPD